MQSFSFAPVVGPPREGHKNYVFVDEHNRHKRLKVMRACNGCRKRKIKCDAATTNTWPCSACTRLKHVCVPPTIGQDGDYFSGGSGVEEDQNGSISACSAPELAQQPFMVSQSLREGSHHGMDNIANMTSYHDGTGLYSHYINSPQGQHQLYGGVRPTHINVPQYQHHPQQQVYQSPPPLPPSGPDHSVYLDPGLSTVEDLSEVLGELKIHENGVAPYIRQQRKGIAEPEAPTQEEADEKLPPLSTGAGSTIRIPPELMPSEEDAMEYFKLFFDDVHPYVPVICRSHFYYQWHHERHLISPLLLEALFACAGRVADDPAQGAQWLALANRHESSFMDVPRLSTIQALIILMKARESVPKKGYYYRSWQTVKTVVTMAKDLDIHEHYHSHTNGKSCDLGPVECLVQTRVWQSLLVIEMMVGAPQGRSDFGVDVRTVDTRPRLDIDGLEPFEIDRSRQFVYFVRNAINIRGLTDVYHQIKNQKDWGGDPRFAENNSAFTEWLQNLPPDLQVSFPPDGSPPWVPSHFVGNMHLHFHLGIIMLHRPQLLASKSFAAGGGWKVHMSLCHASAKCICRLQEALLERYGLQGLLFMQRGISFAIYSILTCTLLHLVAITSPDPEFNSDAREYFTRHMRILEQCSSGSPMPGFKAHIDSLRLAFSADTSRPFELKPSFPYGSPSESYQQTPPLEHHYPAHLNQLPNNMQSRVGYIMHPITPPISAGTEDSKSDPSQMQPLELLPQSHSASHHAIGPPLVDENSWDPTRIINQWDMAFSVAPSNSSTNSPPITMAHPAHSMPSTMRNLYTDPYTSPTNKVNNPVVSSVPTMPPTAFDDHQILVTPRDWQQSVASVFDPQGLKRRWTQSIDLGGPEDTNNMKRQR